MITITETETKGYALAEGFTGPVRVYTITGRVLSGRILQHTGGCILLADEKTSKKAFINLDHIVTITGETQ